MPHAHSAAVSLAERSLHPPTVPSRLIPDQSLAVGAAGVALMHIERALTGQGSWHTAHTWLAAATRSSLATGRQATLFFGAPAVAFAISSAAGQERYARALTALDQRVAAITRQRVQHAHARIDRAEHPVLAEFDLINGLTGLGAYHLRCDPHGWLLREVLAYLVRLTQPIGDLPGWWTSDAPTGYRAPDRAGGHANHGMAHGIAGPLALLSLTARAGIGVPGQNQAIERICAWLDTWRQDDATGPWWPEILTLDDLQRQRPTQAAPGRPSWCYGTPGLARAQQLAGQATGDTGRQRTAEDALASCLSDARQLARLTDHSLCHGTAGAIHTSWRVAADAPTSDLVAHVHALAVRLQAAEPDETNGFLRGAAGHALALYTAVTDQPPASGWDTCLLLN